MEKAYKVISSLLIVIALVMGSCRNPGSGTEVDYSFFVAGHTYGNTSNGHGLHPPFRQELDTIVSYPHMEFGVLAGDIVLHGKKENWDAVDREISELQMPVYIVPGNHDVAENYELFAERYGDRDHDQKTYRYFLHRNDLIILLDGNLDAWSITGDQLSMLKEALQKYKHKVNHVFVFVHQLIWWNEHTVFRNVVHNWPPYTPDTTNYWSVLEPVFQQYTAPVYLFAGDLGIFKKTTPFLYYQDQNVTYVATGMGSEENDNYVIVNVLHNKAVVFELVALQGDRHRFGRLENYILP